MKAPTTAILECCSLCYHV